ncbi:MAG: TIGR04211 family SH3 domain-containing protein [Desulfobulbaceae bacterium]|jgi:SH3 domain protein|nr:TIGR04211 family SH3 domain-containing protein [Desulfobulbaceae bacterium]
MNMLLPRYRPTFTIVSLLLLGCLSAAPLLAETRYIKPNLEVGIRQAQSNTAKVVTNVPMGAAVELVQGEKEWSLVRLQNATEGWVRNRFLSSSPLLPASNLKGGLGTEGAPIDVPARFKELADENGRLRKELATCSADRSTLADKYQTLAGDPNSVLHAKTSLGEAQRQIEDLQTKLATAQLENTVLEKNESIKWFLAGSLVLLFGWLVGRFTANGRKKKPSLL